MQYGTLARDWVLGDGFTLMSGLTLGSKIGGWFEFERLSTSASRQPTFSVFLERAGDITPYVKNVEFNRAFWNTLHEPNPGTGSLTIVDTDNRFIENGHTTIKANDKIKIWAGFNNLNIPRFTGIVTNPNLDTRSKTIIVDFSDYGYILRRSYASGDYTGYNSPKLLINKLLQEEILNDAEFENEDGQPTEFNFGTKLGINGTATGGSATELYDTAAGFVADGIKIGMAVRNTTDESWGRITTTAAATITCSAGFHSGSDNTFAVNDTYEFYDALNLSSRTKYAIIHGCNLSIFYNFWFDENGVLQCRRRNDFDETDWSFTDSDIMMMQHQDLAELINQKTIDYGKSVRFEFKFSDGVRFNQRSLVKTNTISKAKFGQYGDSETDELIGNWTNAGRLEDEVLGWYAWPRHLFEMRVPALPQFQLNDRISIASDRYNVRGKFIIIGIHEVISPGNFWDGFTIMSHSERY